MMRVLAFLFGLLLVFNARLPVGEAVRTADVVSALSIALVGWSLLAGRRLDRAALVLGLLLLVSVEWIGAEFWVSGSQLADPKVRVVLERWLIGLAAAFILFRLSSEQSTRTAVFLGAIVGALCGLETVWHDWMTFNPGDTMPGLNMDDIVYIDGVYRASGMYSHPNEAAGVVLLAAPLLIGLVEERRLPRISLLIAVAVAVGVFWLTKSRSQMVLTLLFLILWCVRNSWRTLLVGAVALIGAGLAGIAGVLPALDFGEFGARLADAGIAGNLADRGFTISESLAIALQHPFGIGSAYVGMVLRDTGFNTTHNALLQLALMGGLPLLLFVLAGLISVAWTLWRRTPWRVEGWLALYLLCVFNVENYFFVSSMSVLAQFLVAVAWRARPARIAQAAPATPATPALMAPPRPAAIALPRRSQPGAGMAMRPGPRPSRISRFPAT